MPKFQEGQRVSNKLFIQVEQLLFYGLRNSLIEKLDVEVVRNALWRRFGIEMDVDLLQVEEDVRYDIYALLNEMTQEMKLKGESLEFLYQEEMLQAEIMSFLMPRNSDVNRLFWKHHQKSPEQATEYFYALSNHSTYIRMDRVSKNISWKSNTDFGEMDITINLSKPEKDPKEITLQKHAKPSVYPKCLLCLDNVGYSGNINHPARHNHRVVEMVLAGEPWYFQYSPYVYYNEHAIVFCKFHRPMKIDRSTFVRLCDFVDYLPHYFVGSNADLHTVGGSILSHDHYQAGNYEMPMMRANVRKSLKLSDDSDVEISILEWPLTVLKVVSTDKEAIVEVSERILNQWINYSDEVLALISHTDERHNTVTPILRKKGNQYEMFLALRNNRKTVEHPDGLFHPHVEHHHIKKENIGLIEVMGLAVLPARLAEEVDLLVLALEKNHNTEGIDFDALTKQSQLIKHLDWIKELEAEILSTPPNELKAFFKKQIGLKFEGVLVDAGIHKNDYDQIWRFVQNLSVDH